MEIKSNNGLKCINSSILQILFPKSESIVKWRNFYMKATGIVRRIDETVIIEPSQENPVKSRGFADLVFFFYEKHITVN